MYTTKEMEREIREVAKSVGLTFKKTNTRLNNGYLYELCVRGGGEAVISNYRLSSAYEDALSGYIATWNGSRFSGNT